MTKKISRSTNVGRKTRKAMCTGKAKRTQEGAKRAIDMRVQWGAARESLNCYPCPWCEGWHVGHRNQELMERRRRR